MKNLLRRRPPLMALALQIAPTAILLASGALADEAETMSGLYQAMEIVTGTDMRSRPKGFAECFRDVLVKVSGEPRLREDPRVAELASRADAFVTSFNYVDPKAAQKVHDDQGTYDRSYNLTVHFDPGRIDKTLLDLGEEPWRGERPIVVPILTVHSTSASYLLSAENSAGADQRAAFASLASDDGLKARFPTDAEFAAWGVTIGQVPELPAESAPNEVPVAGTLTFDPTLPGWVGAWRTRWHGVEYQWRISGVNYDSAFRNAVRGVLRIASGHDGPV
jgi:uncharacterized protein